ncbi:MAG: alpha/beta hydrolase [Variibacter sp.]|nr:alpha/beta hydrolase [Variibacter sp.]
MKLVSIPANPAPEGAVVGELRTPDGVSLRFVRWPPPPGRKGTVCLFQGRAEFIEKYFEVVAELRARGFAVATLDWRGQGLSQRPLADPRKGHVRKFSEYDTDLDTFMREVVLPDCPPPYFALAHSMGGAILLRAARQGRRWFERMVFSAPMIALYGRAMSPAVRASTKALRLLGRGKTYVPGGGATSITSFPFKDNPLTSDPARYARTGAIVEAAPELGLGSPTVAWLDAAFATMAAFADPSYPRRIRQPILIVAAGQDTVVSTPAIEQFAIRMRAGAHLVVPGARHELLMEQDFYRQQFWAAFDAFVPGSAPS